MTFDEAYNKIKENVQEEIVKEKIKTISKEFNENLKNYNFQGLCAKSVGLIWKNYLTRIHQGPKLYFRLNVVP